MYYSPQTPVEGGEQQTVPPPPFLIYANRIRVTRNLRALTNRLIIASLVFIPIAYTLNSLSESSSAQSPIVYFSLTLFVIAYALLLGKLFLNRVITERALLLNSEPVLTITSEGIAMRGSLSLTTIFLRWNEIESIDIYTFMYKYLCVRPRNTALFMQRLPLWERALKQIDLLYGMPPLAISLFYLDKPVEEILQQLYYMYAKELSYYHVQVRS